jgi:aminomethyltransferase
MTTEPAPGVALLRTALHGRHVAARARMVDFGGWDMPIQYGGILAEHHAVRRSVGVFDLSHMGRLYLRGPDARALAQYLTTNDVSKLQPGRAHYSLVCGDDGRILDDVIAYNLGDEVLLVVNASNREKILARIAELRRGPLASLDVTLHDATLETAMLGFQGPDAERLLQPRVGGGLADLRYYAALSTTFDGVPALVARTGYTGEDGFEVIVPAEAGPAAWDALLEGRDGAAPTPCGLGARDTLRLEAGMALYGHEIDETRNPYQAGLGRVVKLDKGDFAGREALARLAERGPDVRLVGFELTEGGVPRQGYPVVDGDRRIGVVTSGNVSPTLGKPIGMAYVPSERAEPGSTIAVGIRGKAVGARVVPLPFYEHRTRRRPAPGAARA